MELKTRNITEKDWGMLCSWWEGHKWPIPNNDALPDDGTGGIIIEENNIPVIAGFIFKTNSKGCWLEFIISDPNYKNDRSHIIDKLIDDAEKIAIDMGFKYMLFIGKSNGIRKAMGSKGWIEDPQPSHELMKRLN